jgi:hypothetical protein
MTSPDEPIPEQLEDNDDEGEPQEDGAEDVTGHHGTSNQSEDAPEVIGPPDDPNAPEVEF